MYNFGSIIDMRIDGVLGLGMDNKETGIKFNNLFINYPNIIDGLIVNLDLEN